MRILVADEVPLQGACEVNRFVRFTHEHLTLSGHEVDFLSSEDVAKGQFRGRHFGYSRALLNTAVQAFRNGRKYDIVNVHGSQSAWIGLFKHQAGNPYVVVNGWDTKHDSSNFTAQEPARGTTGPSLFPGLLESLTCRWQTQLGLSHADKVFWMGEADPECFARKHGIARDKVVRFPSWAAESSLTDPTRAQQEIKTNFDIEAASNNLLSVYKDLIDSDRGWIRPRKMSTEPHRYLSFCFVSNFSPDWNAGASGSILAIGKSLERIGHSVQYCWKQPKPRFGHSSFNNLLGLPWSQYDQVKAAVSDSHPDVVIVSQPFAYPVFEKLPKLFPKTLFLNFTHGWEHRHDIAESTAGWEEELRGLHGLQRRVAMMARARICRRTALAMDGLLAPCVRDGHFVLRQYGVPQEKLLLMTYGLDDQFLQEMPPHVPGESIRMLFFGQYVPRKGSLVLDRLLPGLGREFENLELTFIVPTDQLNRIEHTYRGVFGTRLHVLPWMNRGDVIKLASQHDIFLFPSMLEGFGKTFLEAMACGLCVVGYSAGGLPDVAVNNEEAFYCEPGDEERFAQLLRDCVANPARTREAGGRARAKTLQYTWQRTAEILQMYCLERLKTKEKMLDGRHDALELV